MQEKSLYQYFEDKEKEWEGLCLQCGTCCGLYDDPCRHLKKDTDNNQYYCEIYPARFGLRKTVKGEKFWCVPIKKIIHEHWRGDYLCAYKRLIKNNLWIKS